MYSLEYERNCLAIKDTNGSIVETFDFNERREAEYVLAELNAVQKEVAFTYSCLTGEGSASRRDGTVRAVDKKQALAKLYGLYPRRTLRDIQLG